MSFDANIVIQQLIYKWTTIYIYKYVIYIPCIVGLYIARTDSMSQNGAYGNYRPCSEMWLNTETILSIKKQIYDTVTVIET